MADPEPDDEGEEARDLGPESGRERGPFVYVSPLDHPDAASLVARDGTGVATASSTTARHVRRDRVRFPRRPTVTTSADVEEAVYHSELAALLKAVWLAQARRAADWAAQWLAIEEDYEARCKLACSLLGEGIEDVALHDGHVAELVLTARAFLDRGAELFARAPWVRHLHITRYGEVGPSLFGSALLRGIQSLGLLGEGLEDDDVAALVQSPHIDGLRWLDLSYNELGERSFEQLATCPALAHLEYLGLEGNASESPVDRMGTDPLDGAVVSTTRTPTGRALEALVGELKWLHAPARYPYSYPPSPLDVAKTP